MTSAIGIAGTGAVAQALGRLLHDRGQPVLAIAGQLETRTRDAAQFIGRDVRAVAVADLPALTDRILIASSDDRISSIANRLADAGFRNGVALHTCGAKGPDALVPLERVGNSVGLLHPLQTVPNREQGVESLIGIPFGVVADGRALAWARDIVECLGGTDLRIDPVKLPLYHAGAVMASGGLIAVVQTAVDLLQAAGVTRDATLAAIAPLCRTTLDNALRKGPVSAVTGPVVRGDVGTVAAHSAALENEPRPTRALYQAISLVLLELAGNRAVPEEARAAIDSAIERLNPRPQPH